MSLPVVLEPAAEAELAEAWRWYEDQRAGLGDELIHCVGEVFDAIAHQPESFPMVHGRSRRALTPRFPYAVHYVVDASQITVIAVFHTSRDPQGWRSRV